MSFENRPIKPRMMRKESVEEKLTSSAKQRLRNKEGIPLVEVPELEIKYHEISEQILTNLNDWLNKVRESLEENKSNSENDGKLREDFLYISKIYNGARKAKSNGSMIGFPGSFGVVYAENNSDVCYKIIYHLKNYENEDVNSVTGEVEIQSVLQDLNIDGAKCPKVDGVIDMGDYHIIKMERLDAVTLGDVMHHGATLPENFDFEIFFKKLKEYLIAIHLQGKFYHNDFHMGNIMIDKKTGDPRVIDFGKSKPAGRINRGARENDFRYFDAVKNEMKLYLQSRGLL